MPLFVQVGHHWVNLDRVTGVELVPDPNNAAAVIAARVHLTTGRPQDFQVPADVQQLAAWLRAHKAP